MEDEVRMTGLNYSKFQFTPVFFRSEIRTIADLSRTLPLFDDMSTTAFFKAKENKNYPASGEVIRLDKNSKQTFPWPYILTWNSERPIMDIDTSTYMEDTYNLAKTYSQFDWILKKEYADLATFATYCEKYGSPFGTQEKNCINLISFYMAFQSLMYFINWQERFNVNDICTKIVAAVQEGFQETSRDTFYLYPSSTLAKGKGEGVGDLIWETEPNSLEETGGVRMFPFFQIRCRLHEDLPLLLNGTQKIKFKFLQEAIFENITSFLNCCPTQFQIHWDEEVPAIKYVLPNHLVYFLFVYLTNPKKYHICPKSTCKKLLTDGRKYCDHEHADAYRKSTDSGKMANMINKWSQNGGINSTLYELYVSEGKTLLENENLYVTVKEILQKWKILFGQLPYDKAKIAIQEWKEKNLRHI